MYESPLEVQRRSYPQWQPSHALNNASVPLAQTHAQDSGAYAAIIFQT